MPTWLYFQANSVGRRGRCRLTLMRKRIARAQLVARREKEEGSAGAVRAGLRNETKNEPPHKTRGRRAKPKGTEKTRGTNAEVVGRYGEHAKGFPSELPLVLSGGVRCEIGAHLALEARLQKIGAGDGHRAAIDLDHKGMVRAIGKLQPEGQVGDKANLVHDSLVRELHAQRQRIVCGARLLRKSGDDVVGMNELHVASSAGGDLQRDREIDDLQLMLDKRPAGFAVLAAPFDVGELDAVALDQ